LAICFHHGFDKACPVKISSRTTEQLALSRWTRGRALIQLEKVGLVAVERKRGRNPVITAILPPHSIGKLDSRSLT
jgi:hypothetical protein